MNFFIQSYNFVSRVWKIIYLFPWWFYHKWKKYKQTTVGSLNMSLVGRAIGRHPHAEVRKYTNKCNWTRLDNHHTETQMCQPTCFNRISTQTCLSICMLLTRRIIYMGKKHDNYSTDATVRLLHDWVRMAKIFFPQAWAFRWTALF